MPLKIKLPAIAILFLISTCLEANPNDPELLTIERIYLSNELRADRLGTYQWDASGTSYSRKEKSDQSPGYQDIVRYYCQDGSREVVIKAEKLIPPGAENPLQIENYTWSESRRYLLIFTNAKRVWRQKTRGEYWIVDTNIGTMRRLGTPDMGNNLMFATFSPDQHWIAYVYQNNIFVEKTDGSYVRQITTDGGGDIINGTSDWAYEEEFDLRNGFSWSPDSRRIAFWQFNVSGVGIFNLINNIDSLYSRVIPIQYPKTGTTNSACRIGAADIVDGRLHWFEPDPDLRNHYIPWMEWAGNSQEILIQHFNRRQNINRLIAWNCNTGSMDTILTEKDDAWVDVVDQIYWIDGGENFVWISERDGWRHLYKVSHDDEHTFCLTPGEYDVVKVLEVDLINRWIYFSASPEDPTAEYIYRVPLEGSDRPERLACQQDTGTYSLQIAPGGVWGLLTYSAFETPPRVDLIQLPEAKVIRTIINNEELNNKLVRLKKIPAEFFRIDIGDGIMLDGWCIKPPSFKPDEKYPVIFYVYGEPWGQTVRKSWGGSNYFWHQLLAQQGYIIMSIDNRGTPAPRGREWRKCINGGLGFIAAADQAAAVKALLKERPYMDPERIGIWGWSAGGSMTLHALFRFPDTYHTGIAIAPVSDQRYYDTIYQERYMDTPQNNPEGYAKNSPITYAQNLKGNLLLVHGTTDDNVHYQGTEKLIDTLIRYNKPFSQLAYPARGHSIYEGENTSRHLRMMMLRYFEQNLRAGADLQGN